MDQDLFYLLNGIDEHECSKPKKAKIDDVEKSTSKPKPISPQSSVEKSTKIASDKKSIKKSKKSVKNPDFSKKQDLAKTVLTKNFDLKLSKQTKRQHSSQKIRKADKKQSNLLKIPKKPKKRPKKPSSKPRFNTQKFIQLINSKWTKGNLPKIPKHRLMPIKESKNQPPKKRPKLSSKDDKPKRIIKKYYWRRTIAYMKSRHDVMRYRKISSSLSSSKNPQNHEKLNFWWKRENPSFEQLRIKHGVIAKRIFQLNQQAKNSEIVSPYNLAQGFWDPRKYRVGLYKNGVFKDHRLTRKCRDDKLKRKKRFQIYRSSYGVNHWRWNKLSNVYSAGKINNYFRGRHNYSYMSKTGQPYNFPIPTFNAIDRQQLVNNQNNMQFYRDYDEHYRINMDQHNINQVMKKLRSVLLSPQEARQQENMRRKKKDEEERKQQEQLQRENRFRQSLVNQGANFRHSTGLPDNCPMPAYDTGSRW